MIVIVINIVVTLIVSTFTIECWNVEGEVEGSIPRPDQHSGSSNNRRICCLNNDLQMVSLLGDGR